MMEYDFNESEQSVYRLEKEEEKMKEKKKKKKELAHSNDFIRNEQNGGKTAVKILEKVEGEGEKKKEEKIERNEPGRF